VVPVSCSMVIPPKFFSTAARKIFLNISRHP
jgi:hypothetical protein